MQHFMSKLGAMCHTVAGIDAVLKTGDYHKIFDHVYADLQDRIDYIYSKYDNPEAEDAIADICTWAHGFNLQLAYHMLGTTLHITDTDLLDTLASSKFECKAEDVSLPFPIVELAFPDRYMIPGHPDEHMVGCLVVQLPDYADHYLAKLKRDTTLTCGRIRINPLEQMCYWGDVEEAKPGIHTTRYRFQSIQVPHNRHRGYDNTPVLHQTEHTASIVSQWENERIGPTVGDVRPLAEHSNLTMKIFLYLQMKEQKMALLEPTQAARRSHAPAGILKQMKKMPTYNIRNLFEKQPGSSDHYVGGVSGHKVSPHMRKRHMRALRHAKYKRNENGSIRIVEVKASLIHAVSDDTVHAERKV